MSGINMSELIGVVNNASLPYSIKQILLVFDQIAYPGYSYGDFPKHLRLGPMRYEEFCGSMDWLYEKGLLFDPFLDIEMSSKQKTLKRSMQRLKDDEYFNYIMEKYLTAIDQNKKAWEKHHRSAEALKGAFKGVTVDEDKGTFKIGIEQINTKKKTRKISRSF